MRGIYLYSEICSCGKTHTNHSFLYRGTRRFYVATPFFGGCEENAQVQIIERHQSLSAHAVLTNAVTEIFAEQNAIIDYYKIQNDRDDASLVDNTYISQQRDSNVKVHTFSFGGQLTRNNLNFYQEGEHIDSTMKGITIIEDQQHVDHYTLVNHAQPNCESHQDYKGIYAGKAVGVLTGKSMWTKLPKKPTPFSRTTIYC